MTSRRSFLQGTVAGVGSLAIARAATTNESPPPAAARGKAYGSGYFGEWINDEHGAPTYRYTCDQLTDPKAVTRTDPIFRGATDQWHQVGNDRLVATASNFGHMQVRQDEGGPKFLNDYIPSEGEFGGGIGWLSDGARVLSTCYTGRAQQFERLFGMGYYRKRVADDRFEVDQIIFAPFGDDPVLMTQVTIRNRGDTEARLRWTEYWGCRSYEFCSGGTTQTETHYARRIFSKQFSHNFELVSGGLIERKVYSEPGRDRPGDCSSEVAQGADAPGVSGGYALAATSERARPRDTHPPPTFLVALGSEPIFVSTDALSFFDHGGVATPAAAMRALDYNPARHSERPALFLQRGLVLQPGESRTLYSLYGYLPEGYALPSLAARYGDHPERHFAATVSAWAKDGLRLETAAEPWVARENAWGNYYLRSGATYDSFFQEHIISQGHAYQYINGGQAAARDPPLHAYPLIFSNPALVKEVIRYTLKMTREDGAVYGSVSGFGMLGGSAAGVELASDYGLWLLLLASDYVLASRDRAFLDETISLYPVVGPTARKKTVGQVLALCEKYLRTDVGGGRHGLLRIRGGDWNDNLLLSHCKDDAECKAVGESVMSAAMAAHILRRYAEMRRYAGSDAAEVAAISAFADAQREAVARQWTGQWYRRAWVGDKSGWLGDVGNLWLEPQPWAIISGAANPERARALIANLNRELRQPSPIGAILCNRASAETDPTDLGIAEEGGVWPAINASLVWALAKVDPAMAWDEWKKNTLARHAAVYPDIWYGIWSGPDTFNSVYDPLNPGGTMLSDLIRKPGQIMDHVYSRDFGMTDFPVMNMHPHSTPLFSMTKLVGAEFTAEGLTLAPVLPLETYTFRSPLLGLERSADGYSGWYAPSGSGADGEWVIRLNVADAARYRRLRVNGAESRLEAGQPIVIRGRSAPGRPLTWSLHH